MLQRASTPSPPPSPLRRASGWEPKTMARGKTSSDASELEKLEWPYDWLPPWRRDRLLGHEAAEKTMLAAYRSGRLHHAWLLAGPRGIGKATLARRFARFLLSGEGEGCLFGGGPDSLPVAAAEPRQALVDARAQPYPFSPPRPVQLHDHHH